MTTKQKKQTLTCVRTKHNPNLSYEDFLESRKLGFGGSDIGDLLDADPYGCKRKLFLERLGLMPDDPESKLSFHLERGKFFEEPVAALFAKKFSNDGAAKVLPCGTAYLKEFPFVRANADRLIWLPEDQTDRVGVLEIKVPSAWSFKKILKEGLPASYILQIQWQMLCYGTTWGCFAVYWPDGHELTWFDVQRDEEMCAMLLEKAKEEWKRLEFWKESLKQKPRKAEEMFKTLALAQGVGMFPENKSETSTQCARCPAFKMCHDMDIPAGVVIDNPELAPTAERYSHLNTTIKALEKEKDELKDMIKNAFAQFPAEKITAGGFDVSFREQSRETISSEVKKILTPSQLVTYTKQTTFPVITVKARKK